jgi:hypothetical protein
VKRRLLNALTAISLLLCVAMGAMWVRSRSQADCLTLDTPHHVTSIVSGDGQLFFIRLTWDFTNPSDQTQLQPDAHWHLRLEDDDTHDMLSDVAGWANGTEGPQWGGFGISTGGHPPKYNFESPPFCDGWKAAVPDWSLPMALLVLPCAGARRLLNRRRQKEHSCCEQCGYDLRATPERCPECGTARVAE